ncbi:MAG: SGNH/GDSL hydrolase family protein [Candidatus Hydrogenedentota bacterium]
MISKLPFNEIYHEPHPYLPFVYKSHAMTQKEMDSTYSLHRGEGYRFGCYTTNNYRHLNGPNGSRNIVMPKPQGMIRINCLGDCITGNYIQYKGVEYSYPLELEKIVKARYPDNNIEINNFGLGCYSSAEVLIEFILSIIDTQPDIVILYNGYNDLPISLTPNFRSDYSHARKNLGEDYYRYKIASWLPALPLAFYNYFVNFYLSQNIRFTLFGAIQRGLPDFDSEFRGLETYRRNTEHLINICKCNGIHIILSTYCYNLYENVKKSKVHLKYLEGTLKQNEIVRKLAAKHQCSLVDNYALVPGLEENYMDSIHFSPRGMRLVAENISKEVINLIENIKNRK